MLISQEKEENKDSVSIRMHASVIKEIEQYCLWAIFNIKIILSNAPVNIFFAHVEDWISYKNKSYQ